MHEFNNWELIGDARDEYLANQEAELGQEPEIATDEELKVLMRELWEEFVPKDADSDYTDRDAFNDYITDQQTNFN
tara:strand:+ start:178 stop:405 length:228 start_codon:yes stop_codon:yes gene_type:complete